ncbi:hypothetical protein P2T68_02705 [Pseudomonas sp. G11]|uniref:hypothetical protein n=1 Tax=Pseudomonas sp. G11 TaxID=528343 RepID=UPI002402BB4A|nr:hypothetical protein [Pseudomonas sp. G11]WEX16257.1 hypothetical protein P2T68_02705 [Pseudomonas sp. G11]
MTTPNRSALEIAHDAHDDLGGAQLALSKLESLMHAALAAKPMSPHVYNLLDIAWNLAADADNTTSGAFEEIGKAIENCAPQNVQSENVAQESGVAGHES